MSDYERGFKEGQDRMLAQCIADIQQAQGYVVIMPVDPERKLAYWQVLVGRITAAGRPA